MPDFIALRGDPSDGLPGVVGIGEKTAARLIADHGSLEAVLAAPALAPGVRSKLRAAIDYLAAATEVVLPRPDVPLPDGIDLRLPTEVADEAFLDEASEQYNLGNAVGRVRAALGI